MLPSLIFFITFSGGSYLWQGSGIDILIVNRLVRALSKSKESLKSVLFCFINENTLSPSAFEWGSVNTSMATRLECLNRS
jgi:hypothetical protein